MVELRDARLYRESRFGFQHRTGQARMPILRTMWQKNALFIGLCLVGLVWLTTSILRRDRIEPPKSVSAYDSEELSAPRQAIEREFRADWEKHGLQSAPRADALTIVRRLSLALTGTVPSVE